MDFLKQMVISTEHQSGMNGFNITCSYLETYLKSGYCDYGSNLLHATANLHVTFYIFCIILYYNQYYKIITDSIVGLY